jgi:hypothetical protein
MFAKKLAAFLPPGPTNLRSRSDAKVVRHSFSEGGHCELGASFGWQATLFCASRDLPSFRQIRLGIKLRHVGFAFEEFHFTEGAFQGRERFRVEAAILHVHSLH